MINITTLTNKYRECVRNLWNIYFLEQVSDVNKWDVSDEYERICSLIFSSLVLGTLDRMDYKKAYSYEAVPEPIPILRVVPAGEEEIPIFINRSSPCSGYWDYPINTIKASDADMSFIDFFDFNRISFRDFKYCRVRIINSTSYPETIGRDALIENSYMKIFLIE